MSGDPPVETVAAGRRDPARAAGRPPAGAERFSRAGLGVEYVEVGQGARLPSLDDVSAVVILGGSMSVMEADLHAFLTAELNLVRGAIDRSVPVLGLCLGAQLVAAAAGGRVNRAPRKTIGFLPVTQTAAGTRDLLSGHWSATDRALRWHEDTFTLPPGAALLMRSEDVPNQAFRIGPAAWGVQFHIEVDRPLIEAWLKSWTGKLPQWDTEPDDLLKVASEHLPHQQMHATSTFDAFVRVVLERERAAVVSASR